MVKSELLYNFLKEEVRLHTSLYKSKSFFSYPLMLVLFFTVITVGGIFIYDTYNAQSVSLVILNLFFVGGVMSGAFGLYAKDFLERKFGDFGRLFSNTLILPIKLKTTFVIFALSDTIFYLFWFILPTILGFSIGNLIMGENIGFVFSLLFSVFLIFLLGLFMMFFLSVLYERNKILFFSIFSLLVVLSSYFWLNYSIEMFFIHDFYLTGSLLSLLFSLMMIGGFVVLSYLSIGSSYSTKFKKNITLKSMHFPRSFDYHVFKDYIDLKRTGGLLGKPLFSVFLPSVLLLVLFSTMDFLATLNLDLLFFSIVFGTLGTQLLNSLINSDSFRYYRFLPITLKRYILSKIKLAFSICFVSGLFVILIYCIYLRDFSLLFASVSILLVLLIYNFTLSFYLTGLNPHENLMQSKTFLLYFILFMPVLLSSMTINVLVNSSWYYFVYLGVFLGISLVYLKLGLRKWDCIEES